MASGIDMRLESTVDNDPVRLAEVMNVVLRELNQAPEVNYAFCSFTADTPHLFVDIDRQKPSARYSVRSRPTSDRPTSTTST